MVIYWKIRYFESSKKKMRDRILFLDIDSLSLDQQFCLKYKIDAENLLSSQELRKYHYLFAEVQSMDYREDFIPIFSANIPYYFEDEYGNYLPEWELRKLLGKENSQQSFPNYTDRYLAFQGGDCDIDFDEEDICQLQIFTELYDELKQNEISKISLSEQDNLYKVSCYKNELELKAYVLLFRKLYSSQKDDRGSFPNICNRLMVHSNTSLAILSEDSQNYFNELNDLDLRYLPEDEYLGAPCIYQLMKKYPDILTVSEFIKLILYTQYQHKPTKAKEQKLQKIKDYLNRCDANEIIKYMFWELLFAFQQIFLNSGQSFVGTFRAKYPTPQKSSKINGMGELGVTTEERRKRDIFNKYKQLFAHELWIIAGRPDCGEYAFEEKAKKRLLLSFGNNSI